MKTKILFCGLTNIMGGVEMYTINLASQLDINAFDIDFLVEGEGDNGNKDIVYLDMIKNTNINIIRTPSFAKKDYFRRKKRLNKIFNDKAYDIVYYNTTFLHRIEIISTARKYNVKKRIIHSHNSSCGYEPNVIVKMLESYYRKNVMNYATDLFACSNKAGLYTFGSSKFEFVANGVDLKKFRFDEQLKNKYSIKYGVQDKIVLGHIGRISKEKNPLFLIKVLKCLVDIDSRYHLLYIGQCEDEILYQQVLDLIKKYNLENHVSLLGKISNVPEVINVFDFFLLPSLFEGFPISAIEAQANGIQCFLSDSIDSNIKMLDNCQMLSIDAAPESWATKIQASPISSSFDRLKYNDVLREKGFDVTDTRKRVIGLLK